jgi:hypothetical protein
VTILVNKAVTAEQRETTPRKLLSTSAIPTATRARLVPPLLVHGIMHVSNATTTNWLSAVLDTLLDFLAMPDN